MVHGVGLHTGVEATLRCCPAPAGQGLVFRRVDLPGRPDIPALAAHVTTAERRTVLEHAGARVETVEHVLAALNAYGVDDAVLELDGPEVPIGDGSASAYARALDDAGTVDVEGPIARHRVTAPVEFQDGDAFYAVRPGNGLTVTVEIDWPHPLIGRQAGRYAVTRETFAEELAGARTFGFASEVAALRARGLIQGGSTANAVVLSDDGLVHGALRWPDEFVRHKATDLIGDLALLGARLEAEVRAVRPSHRGNVALVRTLTRALAQDGVQVYGIEEIMAALPHRYPMLLVDRIVEMEAGKRVVGIKNVTINEPFFQGHFPGHPIMPGVLLIEAMGQVGGMLLFGSIEHPETKLVYFLGIDNAKFRRPVVPGDQVRFEVDLVQRRGMTIRLKGVGLVEGQTAVEAELLARIIDR